ncbi:MAG: hypothetical protein HQL57_03955 [Magnetococcales bacterium]|nr:hypothetical protein [Magnetococcales bacterium]
MSVGQVNPLDTLRTRLVSAFEAGLCHADGWADKVADREMVERVRIRHDGPGLPPDPATIASAVAHFRRTGKPEGWRGLKRVCFGAGSVDEKGWCVLSDERLRGQLIELAQGQREARRRVKCYQALLSSYWSFPLAAANVEARAGWLALRGWLDGRMPSVSSDLHRTPGWFQTLVDHHNLLRDDPCGRYGQKLLTGDGSELQAAISGLGIPSDSWVPEEAVIAQMRAGCGLGHERFRGMLPGLLSVAMGEASVRPSQALQTRCVAMLVVRYAKVPGTPESPALRDAATGVIGNPWLRRASWDANVVDERGRPDDEAREMVFGWLKRRLIVDFFELLSEDGVGESRRLDYWLRFEPFVDDMWFALGRETRGRRGESFEDFRRRARGRLLDLEGATVDNNAFIMRMGEYLAVEFGAKGNACFLFRWDSLPERVMEKLFSGKGGGGVEISDLKSRSAEMRLIHKGSAGMGPSWEQRFDQEICPLIGNWPGVLPGGRRSVPVRAESRQVPAVVSRQEPRRAEPPPKTEFLSAEARAEVLALVASLKLKVENNRSMGGVFWIIADDRLTAVRTTLGKWGFRYRPGKGWWKE